ncbi:hypothetical protein GUJ93_ZPchr0008g12570 [Zizania palustris]|uniref:Uncharacterized protein n=1 Tax=Zizania palustris TaxID=103762 RepID=A0A8J5RII2_ZIZPA|nr:hypothetical protein GUJ93_ZPchr0008g12570 [Zizania palustris]
MVGPRNRANKWWEFSSPPTQAPVFTVLPLSGETFSRSRIMVPRPSDRLAGPPPPPPPPLPRRDPAPSDNHVSISAPLLQPAGAGAVDSAPLARWLRRLEVFLSVAGLSASTHLGKAAAASALAVVGVALPALAVGLSPCRARGRGCDEFEVEVFEVCVMLSQAAAAAVALACVSRKMAMYGLRKFLFVDPEISTRIRFQKEYATKIKDFFCTILWWILPCFAVKVIREMFRFSHIFHESTWRSSGQFAILFKTTAYNGPINFTNGGDIAVSSVVQVVGLVLCLHAAAKISHRAQNIASLSSRWHALVTCSSDSTYVSTSNSSGNLVPFPAHMFLRDFSESDLESLESGPVQGNSHTTAQLASYMSSYHKRESLVLYLLANPGGITIFGWIVDRTFLNTILMLELTLVLFVLSKTIVIPARTLVVNHAWFPWSHAVSGLLDYNQMFGI